MVTASPLGASVAGRCILEHVSCVSLLILDFGPCMASPNVAEQKLTVAWACPCRGIITTPVYFCTRDLVTMMLAFAMQRGCGAMGQKAARSALSNAGRHFSVVTQVSANHENKNRQDWKRDAAMNTLWFGAVAAIVSLDNNRIRRRTRKPPGKNHQYPFQDIQKRRRVRRTKGKWSAQRPGGNVHKWRQVQRRMEQRHEKWTRSLHLGQW